MDALKRLNLYRSLERLLLVILVGEVGAVSALYSLEKISKAELVIGIVLATLIILLLIFIQRSIDRWVSNVLSQVDFTEDAAFTALYDNSPVAYITTDKHGQILGYNAAAVKLMRERIDTMQGVNLFSAMVADDDIDLTVLAAKVEAGMTINDLELQLKNSLGEFIWVMFSVFSYRNNERVVSLMDITDQKHIDTAKSEFVALATHQLRTPIAAIRWNVELLHKNIRDVITSDQERYLAKIERNVLRMIALINDFLSVSKLEMGTFASQAEDVNLSDFYNSILDEYAEKITEKNIQVVRNDDPAQTVVRIDSRLLHIIVSNLVSNAVKYLTTNGVLNFSYIKQDRTLELVVSDNGIGIPEREVGKLFTKFYRASNAQSHQTEGTGLGLYIVKQSAELLGGSITVEAAENQGAKFIVKLPVV